MTPTDARTTAPSSPDQVRRTYYPSLDGIRAVAVLLVVIAHGSIRLWPDGVRLRSGWIGVELFFVLSGFLITSLLLAERRKHGRVSLSAFYVRRGLRIWPLYYTILALYVWVLPNIVDGSFSGVYVSADSEAYATYQANLWPHFIFLQNYVTSATEVRLGLGIFWSLAVEEHFYLAWPLIVKFSRRTLLTPILVLAILASAGSIVLDAIGVVDGGPNADHFTHNNLVAIGLGCLIAVANHTHRSTVAQWLSGSWIGFLGWAVVGWFYLAGWQMSPSFLRSGPTWIPDLLVAAASAAIVAQLVAVGPDGGHRLLRSKGAVHVGRVSYGIYLTHALVLGMLAPSLRFWNSSFVGGVAAMILFSCLSISVASVIYRRFEAPILRQKSRFERV